MATENLAHDTIYALSIFDFCLNYVAFAWHTTSLGKDSKIEFGSI